MRGLIFTVFIIFLFIAGDVSAQSRKHKSKKVQYDEIHFEDLMKRYLDKEIGPLSALEGIYSVSCVITKKGRSFLFGTEKEKIIERKDNYARVAILKDRPGSNRDYIEVSLSYREADKYPVMGELNILSEGRGLIYKHLEPDGTSISFAMTNETDLIEGEYSVTRGNNTITYHLSYLRLYPKASGISLN